MWLIELSNKVVVVNAPSREEAERMTEGLPGEVLRVLPFDVPILLSVERNVFGDVVLKSRPDDWPCTAASIADFLRAQRVPLDSNEAEAFEQEDADCESPTIRRLVRRWHAGEPRPQLEPYLRLKLDAASDAVELRRRWMVLDWYTRVVMPRWVNDDEDAEAVCELPEVVDDQSASQMVARLRPLNLALQVEWRRPAPFDATDARAAAHAAAFRVSSRIRIGDPISTTSDLLLGTVRESVYRAARLIAAPAAWRAMEATAKDPLVLKAPSTFEERHTLILNRERPEFRQDEADTKTAAYNAAYAALAPRVEALQAEQIKLLDRLIAVAE